MAGKGNKWEITQRARFKKPYTTSAHAMLTLHPSLEGKGQSLEFAIVVIGQAS